MTLEQKRAQYAWTKANDNNNDKFKKLAKNAPVLIMSNGLMPSLAFWWCKNENKPIVNVILGWLYQQRIVKHEDFYHAMEDLQSMDSVTFRNATEEALEFLKWLRNFASAIIN